MSPGTAYTCSGVSMTWSGGGKEDGQGAPRPVLSREERQGLAHKDAGGGPGTSHPSSPLIFTTIP